MSLSAPTPDVPGFADAQDRLRQYLGRDVRFYGQAAIIYDPAIPPTAFNDEGIPLDPLASGAVLNEAAVDIPDLQIVGSARVNVLYQPLAAMRRDETAMLPTGERSRLNKDLICDLSVIPYASGATHFQVGTLARDTSGNVVTPQQWTPDDNELWEIVQSKTDGFGGLQRYLVFGRSTR